MSSASRLPTNANASMRPRIVAPWLIWPPLSRCGRSRRTRRAVVTVGRKVSAQALVSFRGNTYSVPPAHVGRQVSVTHRLGAATIGITTTGGVTVAVHPRRTDGAGAVVRAEQHVTALKTRAFDMHSNTRRRWSFGLQIPSSEQSPTC